MRIFNDLIPGVHFCDLPCVDQLAASRTQVMPNRASNDHQSNRPMTNENLIANKQILKMLNLMISR